MKKIFSYLFLTVFLLSFNYVLAFSIERDLNFLKDLSNEDLNPLIFVMKDGKNSQLNEKEKIDPQKYLNKIVENLEKDAIDELNIKKDTKSVSYKQILETVCKNQNIEFNENISTKELGTVFIRQKFIDTFDKMNQKQKESLVGVLREAMSEEEFETFLEKTGGTSGLLVSSGKTLSDLLFDGHPGDFMIAICLASDITNAVDEKEPKESISYTGIVPAITYIESLRIVKTQMPKSDDNSNFIKMLIVVSVPVLCVLLFLIYMDPKKRLILIEFIKFLFICFFVAAILLFVMLAMESAADSYITVVFIACVLLVSMLINWLLSIQVKIIKNRIKKKNLKRLKNKKSLKVSKKQNIETKEVSKENDTNENIKQ